jgi:hypothetical protein
LRDGASLFRQTHQIVFQMAQTDPRRNVKLIRDKLAE